MTTEIAIMNKSAIALAADSAVTISMTSPQGENHKVLNSANKLFSLSKHAPVGLMIYGNASMLGIPWETIVKMYREHLKNNEFPNLADYAKHFFSFLDKFDITNTVQQHYIGHSAAGLFVDLKEQLKTWVEDQEKAGKQFSENQIKTKLGELIKIQHENFSKLGDKSSFSKTKRANLRKTYRLIILEVASEIFEKLPLTTLMKSQLVAITVNAASIGRRNQSGIVIAGFGTKDLYPHCLDHDVAAVFAGKTIKQDGEEQQINHEKRAIIIPFAQSNDVMTFMKGIGPTLEYFLGKTFYGIMVNDLPEKLSDEIATSLSLTGQQQKTLQKIAKEMCKGACDFAFQKLEEQKRTKYIDPVVEATAFLNKAELADMAETLVNLVSFRKKVTMETETVGGPIDVAIISKGDGFVWIKRKHYFPPELNHHFFSNYYKKEQTDG